MITHLFSGAFYGFALVKRLLCEMIFLIKSSLLTASTG